VIAKRLQVNDNEVMRAFKTVNDAYIEPISFIVPRRVIPASHALTAFVANS
jgi:coronin-1B/1C/6